MNRETFDKHVADTVARTADLLVKKGAEYSNDADRLSNFKRTAEKNGQTVLEAWMTYWSKHVDSINTYVARVRDLATSIAIQDTVYEFEALLAKLPLPGARSISDKAKMAAIYDAARFRARVNAALPGAMCNINEQLSEPIEGRFDDNINYSFLGAAIIKELEAQIGGPVGDSRP